MFTYLAIKPRRIIFRGFLLKAHFSNQPAEFRSKAHHSFSDQLIRHNEWMVLLSILCAILIWALVVDWAKLPAFVLPSPTAVWAKFLQTLQDGTLLSNAGVTLLEVLAGLFTGTCLATTLGYFLARSSSLEQLVSPILVAGQAVPTVAIAPLLIIWFGSGMISKVIICTFIVFFPVLVNTIIGFRDVPANLRDLMRAMHANKLQMLRYLELPAALPVLFGGLRIGATLSVVGAVVGEFVGSDSGLGFLINLGRGQYDMALVFVAIFTLIAMALILYGIAMVAENLTMPWKHHKH
jgi:NitT/TauT family transport system permease protein